MNQKMNSQLLQFAKSMRHAATDAENLLWQLLSANALWCSNLDVRR
jgi:adenine-specific DNA-methyltransferase